MPLHFDLDPREGRHAYQGVVHLTDVGADDGAFRCVPGVFADLAGWLARHPDFEPGAWSEPDLEGHPIVAVPARAGDLVVFDSRLLHGNAAHRGSAPRVVQYVAMTPPGFWAEAPDASAELHRSGYAPEHLRRRPGWAGPATEPPARLTALGHRLLGLA
jgi:ectoine hydroxylase-related dioxygenase (phytanoyl-CoA dioxygenase family)